MSDYSTTIRQFVTGKILSILAQPDSKRTRLMAILRREAGNAVKENAAINPAVWAEVFEGSPDEFHKNFDGSVTKEERAIMIALTLFALTPVDKETALHGNSFGTEMVRLAPTMEDKYRVGSRFYPVLSSSCVCEAGQYIRRCLTLVKSKVGSVCLDYGRLAQDLFLLQCDDEIATCVVTRWNREFAKIGKVEP